MTKTVRQTTVSEGIHQTGGDSIPAIGAFACAEFSFVLNDVHIDRHCLIGSGSILDREYVVGNYVNIDLNVVLEKGVIIGDGVHIGTCGTILEVFISRKDVKLHPVR